MYSIGSSSRRKTDPDPWDRLVRWLALSLVLMTIATWYVETRIERFVMSDENLVTDGAFDEGLPGSPNWEYAGLSGEIWAAGAGINGGGALRLGGDSTAFLRYRLSSAWRADGYFVGLCLRSDETAIQASRTIRAEVLFRRGDLPQLRGAGMLLADSALSDQWHCVLETVSVPLALDELLFEIRPAPGPGLVWVDQVTLHPALHPPLYKLLHQAIAIGWVLIGVGALAAVLHWLGIALGLLTIVPSAIALVLAVAGPQALSGLTPWISPFLGMIDDVSESLFEALRVFTRDLSWRAVGDVQPESAFSLIIAGVFIALSVMLRYRWIERPWRRVIWYGALFGLGVQAIRLLLHTPTYATVNWVLDPLAVAVGILPGALLFELLFRPRNAPSPPG